MDREKAKQVKKRFGDQFTSKTGLIEGQEGFPPVTLNGISCSLFCSETRTKEFGCPVGQTAILVEWLPAGLTHGPWPKDGGLPSETGVDKKKIPRKKTWVTFPRTFEGFPVYYKRGSQAFAL